MGVCNILIGDHLAYYRSDRFSLVGDLATDLARYLAHINANAGRPGIPKTLDEMAYNICHKGIPGSLGNDWGWNRGFAEIYPFRLTEDIEYLYIITGTAGKYRLHVVDVLIYVENHPEIGWGGLFSMGPDALRTTFCHSKYYWVPIPKDEVPLEERRYYPLLPLTYKQAKYCGLDNDDLGYGKSDRWWGFVRVKNAKRPKMWRK